MIGWLVGWLVGNTVLSETAQRIFLTFCMKLGDYKGRRVTAEFLKKILDLEIFAKNDFFGFSPEVTTKYENCFSEKSAI